jgi:hypothetical protein
MQIIKQLPFSFLNGFLQIFRMNSKSRIQRAQALINNNSGNRALEEDWIMIGHDFQEVLTKGKTIQ